MEDIKKYGIRILVALGVGVILYAPFGLHLRFSDPGIARGGFSLAFGVILTTVIVYNALKLKKTYNMLKAAGGLNGAGGSGGPDGSGADGAAAGGARLGSPAARKVLSDTAGKMFTGNIALQAIEQSRSAVQKAETFRDIIDRRFGRGSLTYARYAGTIDQCLETLSGNTDILADRIVTFDEKEYSSLSGSIASGAYKRDQIDDRVQEDRLLALTANLDEMRHILDKNEKMILQLDICSQEVAALQNAENDRENEAILQEIQHLIDTTKYYK